MEVAKARRRSRGMSTLEKWLIFLFVVMTGVCVAVVTLYFIDKEDASTTHQEGPDSGCGGPQELTAESGTFTSIHHPSSYDNGRSCSWHITVDPDKVISLRFEEFAIEDTDLCTADFITLRDSLGVIGKYCGYTKPLPLVSLTNRLTIYFDTNDRKTDQGFKAHYEAVSPERTSEIAGAGGSLQGDRGDLMTPGFPDKNYPNGALYQWKITVPEGERVRLTFTSFDLVPEVCGDFVQVYDGSMLLGKFCGGTMPKPVESSSNTMIVRFKSDSTGSSRGFTATYTKSSLPPIVTTMRPTTTSKPTTQTLPPTTSGSGGAVILTGRKGTIQSDGFPNPYPAHQNSSWKITVPKGFLMKFQITEMAITGETGQCKEDKLLVSDAYSTLGIHCGYIRPPVVVAATNTMTVSFQSDSRLTDRGFSAKWEAVYPEDIAEIQGCGMSSKEETGVIKSANWPMNYKANAECMWNVVLPFGKKITLTFTHFDLEPRDLLSSKCFDNVMVYDINGITNALIQKHGPFCGTKMPKTILSKGSRLMIRFHSDLFTEAKGFRAYWTTNPSLPAPTEPPVPPNPWDGINIDWPSTCGKPAIPPAVMSRIVNGEAARPHSWPWQVSMQVWPASRPEPTFFHTCGGTLIHKNWVLTAAHCFINYADELHRWRMCLGKHNLTFTEPSERCLNVTGIYRHEAFKYPTVPTVEFDIALVRLDGEAEVSDQISYACLPTQEEVLPGGKKCYASGWGDETGDSLNAKVAEALNQVALPVVPYNTCKRMDYWWFQVKTSMICCGYTLPDELKSVCQGDSGGPLVCQDTPSSPWEVHGITSFGPIGCIMNKKPSVFTRSSAYIPWINNIIRRDIYNEHTSGCGGAKDLTGIGGTLSSMGYPSSYSNKAKCQWNIQAPAGKLVHLHFSNFSLEESQLCLNDKVSISDRTGSLGTYCSHTPPMDRVSDGNSLHISFSSNDKVVDTGFMATWKAVDPSEAPCGGSFSSAQGELTSPNWPKDYPGQAACTWRIKVPSVKSIHVVFTHFELQAVNVLGNCVDYVEVFNGESMASQGRFCGFALPPKMTVPGDTVVIRFLSNGVNHQQGFRGYWTTDASVIPTLPPPIPNPWDNITISWPEDCGNPEVAPSTGTARVVNGVEAVPHSWPWQVSMQATPMLPIPYMHGCGGSLIHEEWILTAAHCFMVPLNQPTFWRMCLGKHHMNSSMDVPSAEACYKVDGIIRHEGFVYEDDRSDITNDIALVHLAQPVNMTREISPICLPQAGVVMAAGTPCFVTGWGDEKGNLFPKVSEKLNQASLPVVDFQTCSKPAYWWDTLRPSMICAGYESPDELKSACQGDSGGPFACKAAGANMTWEVHGVVSFGPQGCIRNKKPSVFTRVSAFSHWINDSIRRFLYERARYN
ncbi:ovochymase-2 [Dunckerocampus dactyliophorus]|uniref:ovochymase-2 n=1 Tax=Dunckerocampus dactyliophorus TaxID=161453 RepID=UPI002406969E|nr:ovochymase-2 [Dunckerocampus dactyliophorus]XP_054634057.1 ovochymase-2 [Dunckerocampus dactyliophorus]